MLRRGQPRTVNAGGGKEFDELKRRRFSRVLSKKRDKGVTPEERPLGFR